MLDLRAGTDPAACADRATDPLAMRFCMVTTFYPPGHTGGDAIYVQALARALVHAGHHVEVVHSGDAFSISERQPPGAHGAGTPVPGDDGVVVHIDLFAGMPDIDLVIAGDGDLRASLADGYAHLANVRFVGPVDALRLADLYGGATATIIPSLAPESFGLVAVESFAFGTPVIALDSGGCGETVRASGGGIVCTDFAALANAVRCLAGNRGLRDELGNRARTACSVHWSEERHLAGYLDKVASVLARVR